ncbi:hypothetical protein [Lacrimispora brassicae]
MAKYGVTNVAGGGGIGSDELSVTKKYVQKGKTYVGSDTNDEIGVGELDLDVITATPPDMLAGKVGVDKEGKPITGTIPLRGTSVHGSGAGLNGSGLYYYIPKGYYDEPGQPNPWVYMTRPEVAAALGIEPWKMRGDVNICGVQGGIPIQGADAGGDHAWNTTWANRGDGNIFMGVRNGHYLNGVNWIRAYIENFWASNIKKGVNIGGVVGTWEGYVPGAQDLYYRGNNVAGMTVSSGAAVSYSFDAGQFTIKKLLPGSDEVVVKVPTNAVGRRYLNVELYCTKLYSNGSYPGELHLSLNGVNSTALYTIDVGVRTLSFDMSTLQMNTNFYIHFWRFECVCYRIWLS